MSTAYSLVYNLGFLAQFIFLGSLSVAHMEKLLSDSIFKWSDCHFNCNRAFHCQNYTGKHTFPMTFMFLENIMPAVSKKVI